MIRDPSDGTVREVHRQIVDQAPRPTSGPDTGIRQPTRTDAQQRLDKSREWLKNYHAAKETSDARGSADTEADASLRSDSVGVEQQGDRGEARDRASDGREPSG